MTENRLTLVREKLNIKTVNELATLLEVKYSSVRDIEAGKQKISDEIAEKLDEKYNINFKWLKLGKGSMFNEGLNSEICEVLEYNNPVSAGKGCFIFDENVSQKHYFNCNYLKNEIYVNPKDIFLMRVMGDSMEPELNDNDIIMVDRSVDVLREGKIYVLRIDNELLVKKVQITGAAEYSLISENKILYPAITVKADEIQIIGRVVWRSEKK